MRDTPCPILLVTASIDTNVSQVFEAMGYGALDAVNTPRLDQPAGEIHARPLLNKIATIGKLFGAVSTQHCARLVAIGASAGGPAAVAKLLQALPGDFPAAIVVVQHVDPQFVPGMVNWLRGQSTLPVQEAREDDELRAGNIFIAATGDHLTMKPNGRLGYTSDPRDYVYRPSVDVFFASVARYYTGEVVGVLLTGMGRDGADGLKKLREQNHVTIAQDQASSAVYGMPKAAAVIGAASEIIRLDGIAGRLVTLMTRGIGEMGQNDR
jgi:two-component system response regulator WspF